MNKQKSLTGYLLILAAITFWIAWLLMPSPGTTNTQYILKAVKEVRTGVLCSVIIQIISSVLYVVALFLLIASPSHTKKITLVGISLVAIGAMGSCADAFFHLLAYGMTDDSIKIQQDVVRVMDFMQTTGVVFLVPLLLSLFIGSLVLAIGLRKQGIISGAATILIIISLSVGIAGGIIARATQYEVHGLSFTTLAIFAMGQAWIGVELISASRRSEIIRGGNVERRMLQSQN